MFSLEMNNKDQIPVLYARTTAANCIRVKNSLISVGLTNLLDTADIQVTRAYLTSKMPEVAIFDEDLSGDIAALIHEMRWSRLGPNPFLSVLFLVSSDRSALMDRMLAAGIDEFVFKPVALQSLLQRLEKQVQKPRNFIATSTYIGPDRRVSFYNHESERPVVPPNALKARIEGKPISNENLKEQVTQTLALLEERRIVREVRHFIDLAGQMQSAFGKSGDWTKLLTQMLNMSRHFVELCVGSGLVAEVKIFQFVRHHLERLQANPESVVRADMVMLLSAISPIHSGIVSGNLARELVDVDRFLGTYQPMQP